MANKVRIKNEALQRAWMRSKEAWDKSEGRLEEYWKAHSQASSERELRRKLGVVPETAALDGVRAE